MQRERDGSAYHGAPMCRCGSRNQKKIGELRWHCQNCYAVRSYRVCNGEFLGFPVEVTQGLDEYRREGAL